MGILLHEYFNLFHLLFCLFLLGDKKAVRHLGFVVKYSKAKLNNAITIKYLCSRFVSMTQWHLLANSNNTVRIIIDGV